jgi:hypothetical protein
LVIVPDINILIEIRKQVSVVEGGLVIHAPTGNDDPFGALREVGQLW